MFFQIQTSFWSLSNALWLSPGFGVFVPWTVDCDGWPRRSHHLSHPRAGLSDLWGVEEGRQEPWIFCWSCNWWKGVSLLSLVISMVLAYFCQGFYGVIIGYSFSMTAGSERWIRKNSSDQYHYLHSRTSAAAHGRDGHLSCFRSAHAR